MEGLKDIFLELREIDKYQRVDTGNPVAWYVGLANEFISGNECFCR